MRNPALKFRRSVCILKFVKLAGGNWCAGVNFLRALDRHLRTRFEGTPSADFNARLRRGIAAEATRKLRPGFEWLPVLAGAVVFVVMVVALFHFRRSGALQSRDSYPVPSASVARRPSPPALTVGKSPPPGQKSALASITSSELPLLHSVSAGRTSPALEVRIDRRELYAVVRLSQAVADGRVNIAALVDSQRQSDEPIAAKPLEIPPLELKPIENPVLESDAEER